MELKSASSTVRLDAFNRLVRERPMPRKRPLQEPTVAQLQLRYLAPTVHPTSRLAESRTTASSRQGRPFQWQPQVLWTTSSLPSRTRRPSKTPQ